jgi:hypothetical protein
MPHDEFSARLLKPTQIGVDRGEDRVCRFVYRWVGVNCNGTPSLPVPSAGRDPEIQSCPAVLPSSAPGGKP